MSATLHELLCIRENFAVFVPDNFFNKNEIELLIKFVSVI